MYLLFLAIIHETKFRSPGKLDGRERGRGERVRGGERGRGGGGREGRREKGEGGGRGRRRGQGKERGER